MPMRTFRPYRILRAGLVIVGAVLRYVWLRWRGAPQASWDRAHARTGRAIYRLATGLGGAFVKLGQVLGARADALPPALIAPLRGLHDRVPPRPFAKLRGHVERELGRSLGDVFAHVDEQPLAAASLAQVHRARLASGDDVVIKIQYPEARKLFPVDFGSLRRAVRVVRWFDRKLDLRPLVDELAEFVLLELDFAREAASTARIAGAFGETAGIRVPRVYEELSTDRILVLEFIEGTAVTCLDELDRRGVNRREAAESIARIYCEMIFTHGFFQGDPHPGNILIAPDGETIVVLDFGLAKELPAGFADGAAAMIVKGIAGDVDGAIEAAHSIGFEVGGDRAAFGDLVKLLMGNRPGSGDALATLSASNLKKVPGHFALIGRVFILLNGISHMLVPGERVIAQAVARTLGPRLLQTAASRGRVASPTPTSPG
jgi:ubiquinone biosynthesis protein